MTSASTIGEELVKLLHGHGVDMVYGIPGVHTVPLYRGLASGPVRHITPRHEQAAAFMADGQARVSGKPGVCFLITGPGLTNAATAMAQAYSDSVPMLVVSSVNPIRSPEKGEGRLHELPDQSAFAGTVAEATYNLESVSELPSVLAQIFSGFKSRRPRPAHLQISTDLLETACAPLDIVSVQSVRPVPDNDEVAAAVKRLKSAKRPLIIIGGGCQDAGSELCATAELIDAPVITTLAAKGVIDDRHPLCVGARLGDDGVRNEVELADVVLVVGSELAPTDLWPHESLKFGGQLIRIDIDGHHFDFAPTADVALCGDCATVLQLLNEQLTCSPVSDKTQNGQKRTQALRELDVAAGEFKNWLDALRNQLPTNTVFCADSTQIVYEAGSSFAMYEPRTWFTSITGFGTLGYALPAAMGASLWLQSQQDARRVVCLIGDGGLQFTLAELMTLNQLALPIDVIVWNNQGYGEIRDSMLARGVEPAGVDIASPDMIKLGAAFNIPAHRVDQPEQLMQVLRKAHDGPRLIDVNLLD